jgi:hypothetical protein
MAVARSARRWLPDPDAWRRLFLDPEARRQFPNSEERWRWLPDPEGERCQGPGAGERQRHSLGKRASGNIAPEAGRRRCRTPRPERRRHTITHERRCGPPPPPGAGGGGGGTDEGEDRVASTDCARSAWRRYHVTSSDPAQFGRPD